MRSLLVAGAVATMIGAGGWAAPIASAGPAFTLPGPGVCNYPGTSGGFGLGDYSVQFCNYPPVLAGMHYKCEWFEGRTFNSGNCKWRWPDNSVAPTPPPEQIFW
ncbi:hypothetical protein [Mycobacterium sp. SMC-4]|uniref:hypothetical protein n=1 Tax=Mycobacterium sp. SMC-4 TaxID=2857059 RepID=UPI003CFDB34A